MITEKTTYGIQCDECGDFFYCQSLHTEEFPSKEDAEFIAELEGWTINDGKHLCPDCYLEKYGEEE